MRNDKERWTSSLNKRRKTLLRSIRLLETQRENEHRFDRDERILELIIRAGRRDLSERDKYWTWRHAELMESPDHTNRRFDALIDIVRADRNG